MIQSDSFHSRLITALSFLHVVMEEDRGHKPQVAEGGTKMKKSDSFLNYNEEDLTYEFHMLMECRAGIERYESDWFLHNLCIEGLLVHARRLIEVFHLKEWEKRRGLISEHLSHANPSNRTDPRDEKRKNPQWDTTQYYDELLDAIHTVADEYKTQYIHHDLLISLLKLAKEKGAAAKPVSAVTVGCTELRIEPTTGPFSPVVLPSIDLWRK